MVINYLIACLVACLLSTLKLLFKANRENASTLLGYGWSQWIRSSSCHVRIRFPRLVLLLYCFSYRAGVGRPQICTAYFFVWSVIESTRRNQPQNRKTMVQSLCPATSLSTVCYHWLCYHWKAPDGLGSGWATLGLPSEGGVGKLLLSPLAYGVPQDSILSPLLLNLYMKLLGGMIGEGGSQPNPSNPQFWPKGTRT